LHLSIDRQAASRLDAKSRSTRSVSSNEVAARGLMYNIEARSIQAAQSSDNPEYQ